MTTPNEHMPSVSLTTEMVQGENSPWSISWHVEGQRAVNYTRTIDAQERSLRAAQDARDITNDRWLSESDLSVLVQIPKVREALCVLAAAIGSTADECADWGAVDEVLHALEATEATEATP